MRPQKSRPSTALLLRRLVELCAYHSLHSRHRSDNGFYCLATGKFSFSALHAVFLRACFLTVALPQAYSRLRVHAYARLAALELLVDRESRSVAATYCRFHRPLLQLG